MNYPKINLTIYKVSEIMSDQFNKFHYNCIYAIKNLLDGRYYIGQTRELWGRFYYNGFSHYYQSLYIDNSMRVHGYENFIVIILKENVSLGELDDNSRTNLDRLERLYIKRLHTCIYDDWWKTHKSEKPQYNQTFGGSNFDQLNSYREYLKTIYPETNGVSPKFIKAGREANLKKYPDTNGAPIEWLEKGREIGRKRMLELYPETNGMPIECLKAGLESRSKLYGLNGMTPNCYKAGLDKLKLLYPETNGMPLQAFEALKKKYSDTNGVPPEFIYANLGTVWLVNCKEEKLKVDWKDFDTIKGYSLLGYAHGRKWSSSIWFFVDPDYLKLYTYEEAIELAKKFNDSDIISKIVEYKDQYLR